MSRYDIALGRKPKKPKAEKPLSHPIDISRAFKTPPGLEMETWVEEPVTVTYRHMIPVWDQKNYSIDHTAMARHFVEQHLLQECMRRGWPTNIPIEWTTHQRDMDLSTELRGRITYPAQRTVHMQRPDQPRFEEQWRHTHTPQEQMARVVGADGQTYYYRTR